MPQALKVIAGLLCLAACIAAAPKCGNEDVVEILRKGFAAAGQTRRSSRSLKDKVDPLFKLPSQSSPQLSVPSCAASSNPGFGYEYSECYIRQVIEGYKKVTSWPPAALKTKVISYKRTTNAVWATTSDINSIISLTNEQYADAGISFVHTTQFFTSNTRFDALDNSAGINADNLIQWYTNLKQDFGIPDNAADRTVQSYIAVVKMDPNLAAGLCFPEPAMMELANSDQLPPWLGSVCLLDYRYFLSNALGGSEFARGLTTTHELGHSLGLLHPHANVPTRTASSGYRSCTAPGSSSCYARTLKPDDYNTGDFISDTDPTPDFTQIPEGPSGTEAADYFDTTTCTAGSLFPDACGVLDSFPDIQDTSRNYMAYSHEVCHDRFTPEQIARMRCFVDRYMDNDRLNAPRNFAPVVVSPNFKKDTDTEILVQWYPPLNLLRSDSGRADTLPFPAGLQYRLEREPAFESGPMVLEGDEYAFLDVNLTLPLTDYKYKVTAVLNSVEGATTSATTAFQSSAAMVIPSFVAAVVVLVLALVF